MGKTVSEEGLSLSPEYVDGLEELLIRAVKEEHLALSSIVAVDILNKANNGSLVVDGAKEKLRADYRKATTNASILDGLVEVVQLPEAASALIDVSQVKSEDFLEEDWSDEPEAPADEEGTGGADEPLTGFEAASVAAAVAEADSSKPEQLPPDSSPDNRASRSKTPERLEQETEWLNSFLNFMLNNNASVSSKDGKSAGAIVRDEAELDANGWDWIRSTHGDLLELEKESAKRFKSVDLNVEVLGVKLENPDHNYSPEVVEAWNNYQNRQAEVGQVTEGLERSEAALEHLDIGMVVDTALLVISKGGRITAADAENPSQVTADEIIKQRLGLKGDPWYDFSKGLSLSGVLTLNKIRRPGRPRLSSIELTRENEMTISGLTIKGKMPDVVVRALQVRYDPAAVQKIAEEWEWSKRESEQTDSEEPKSFLAAGQTSV